MEELNILVSVTSLGAFALFSRLYIHIICLHMQQYIHANTILYRSKDLSSTSRSL